MTHLDEGRIQAFLDDELPAGDRAAAAEHIMACASCRATHDELRHATSVFSEAMNELDVQPRAEPVWARVPGGARTATAVGPFVRAAVLVLVLAAAASAAVPGSPIREWIVAAVQDEPAAPVEAPSVAPAPTEEPAAPPSAPAGVSVTPGSSRTDVELSGVEGATIRLVETDGERVAVSATGGAEDPTFRTGLDRIEVRGGVGGEIRVEVPATSAIRLLVDGRVYAEGSAGDVTVRVPGRTVEGGIVWR